MKQPENPENTWHHTQQKKEPFFNTASETASIVLLCSLISL